jgi:hypothetical protein
VCVRVYYQAQSTNTSMAVKAGVIAVSLPTPKNIPLLPLISDRVSKAHAGLKISKTIETGGR